jgi:hypothetical protein
MAAILELEPLEPLYNPARTNKQTLWFHHHHGVIPSGGAAPLPAAAHGSHARNDEVYQIGFGSEGYQGTSLPMSDTWRAAGK